MLDSTGKAYLGGQGEGGRKVILRLAGSLTVPLDPPRSDELHATGAPLFNGIKVELSEALSQ